MARSWSSNHSNQSRNWSRKSNLFRQKYSSWRNKEPPPRKWWIWKFERFRRLDRHYCEHRYHSWIILRRNKLSASVRIGHGHRIAGLPRRPRKHRRIQSTGPRELANIPALEPANLPRTTRRGGTQLYGKGHHHAWSSFFTSLHRLLVGPQYWHPGQPGHNDKFHHNRPNKLIW